MSRSTPDQRGGHPLARRPLSGVLDCLCCEHIPPKQKDPNRTRRNRIAMQHEYQADPW